MAAKKESQKSKSNRLPWKAHPDDAIRLAALRWFAITIERLSIEVYASDPTKFLIMEKLLRRQVKDLSDLRFKCGHLVEDDCPIGYVLCKDGLCSPMCDGLDDN